MATTAQTLRFLDEAVLSRVIATQAVPSQGYPLAPAASITHTVATVAGLGAIMGYVFADQDGTMFIEQSVNGIAFDISTAIPVAASIATPFDVPIYGLTARARFVNGGLAQTIFRSNVVAKPMSGGPPGGGILGAVGNDNSGLVIANTIVVLAPLATFTGPVWQLQPATLGARFTGYDIIRGFAQSDVAGTIAVVQGLAAGEMVAPYTNATQTTFAVPAGGNGVQFTQIIAAPFVLVELRNGALAETRLRFYAYALG